MQADALQDRIARMGRWLQQESVDAFLLPRTDAHHVEWLRASANRVARFCGFGGSYGKLLFDVEGAALLTSAIYREAAEGLFAGTGLAVIDEAERPLEAWIKDHASPGKVIAVDPWLHTHDEYLALAALVDRSGGDLRSVTVNPVDALLPPIEEPVHKAQPHPENYAGQSAASKRVALATTLAEQGLDACFLGAPDSICWLLNIRGSDVFAAPLVYSFALVHASGEVDLFVDPGKTSAALAQHLGPSVRLHAYADVERAFDGLAANAIGMDFSVIAHAIVALAARAGVTVTAQSDPCQLPKACKNSVELQGARACHVRDGVAQVRFWAWWSARQAAGDPPTELEAETMIDGFRAEDSLFRGVSFATISAGRAHASMPHYHSHETTNVPLDGDGFYLLDSGGQYLDGTTDVTRTYAVGRPAETLRQRYTQVLKGMIAASSTPFPAGARGFSIDALARMPLWAVGADFSHATGHGVGSYLGVHEGPIRLRAKPDPTPLQLGMIVSIEPGCYVAGEYGVRHENLVAVIAADGPGDPPGGFCKFETLTLCPFDLAPLERELLTRQEIDWLDAYHGRVWTVLAPLVEGETREWLRQATRPLVSAPQPA